MPKVNKKSRSWVLVCNNYTQENLDDFDKLVTQYRIRGLEIGEKCGTPHVQGYAYFKNAIHHRSLQKKLPRYVLIAAQGTPAQNRAYCIKEGSFNEEGVLPAQGIRNDIHKFVLDVKASDHKIEEATLLEDYSQMVCKYPMFVDRVMRHFHPPKPLTVLNNFWYYGGPGTGKTTAAKALGTHFVKFPNKWHCGYAGQDVVIVEDLEPRHAGFMSHYLKMWADLEPYTAQTKGSSMFIRPKTIVVTSNYSIAEMGWDAITTLAIQRRFLQEFFSEVYVEKI